MSKFKINYKKSVIKDLKRIERAQRKKIILSLEKKLRTNPYVEKPLRGQFEGLYRLRVGDYRIIYTILGEDVLVLRIGDRKDVYKR